MWSELVKDYLRQYDAPENPLSNLDVGKIASFAAWVEERTAQQSVHPTLGILAAFRAFVYAVKSSVLTAFRRPPQRG